MNCRTEEGVEHGGDRAAPHVTGHELGGCGDAR